MYRGNNMTFSIDALDVEDGEIELNVEIEYKEPGGIEWVSAYFATKSYSVESWKFDFMLPFNAQLGTYSFRARASDMDNDWSDYYYQNNSLIVINSIPLTTSFEQTPNDVYRTGEIIITADCNDLETKIQQLECMIYYQTPGSGVWEQLYAKFNESIGTWQSKFITSIDSVLGNYSFKIQFRDSDGVLSKEVYANNSVRVKNNLPIISSKLDDIHVGKTQYSLNLNGYGIDIESSKNSLKWLVDESTINTNLFQIDMDKIENQELLVYPKKSIEAKDDITIILIDSDNGKTVKRDVTIIVNSKSDDEIISYDENNSITPRFLIYIIVIIIIITLFVLFIYYRRRKQRKKEEREREEELSQESEETQNESTEEALLIETEKSLPDIETPEPVPVPSIEESPEPFSVPIPLEAETQQLSTSTTQDPNIEAQPTTDDTEQEINSGKPFEQSKSKIFKSSNENDPAN